MTNFQLVDNEDGTFRIECRFIVYRELFKKHPSWTYPTGDEKTGFYTKYYFLVEDDIMGNIPADAKIHFYRQEFDKLITEIENNPARWDEFPFKDRPIVYYK